VAYKEAKLEPTHQNDNIKEDTNSKTLILFLRSHLGLSIVDSFPPEEFTVNTEKFYHKSERPWQGFYDWLRDSSSQVLGVRFWLFEDADLQLTDIPSLTYVSSNSSENYVEIYFSASRQWVQENSDDQDFGDQGCFLSDKGTWAIVFDLSMLNNKEIESIKNSNANWENISQLAK